VWVNCQYVYCNCAVPFMYVLLYCGVCTGVRLLPPCENPNTVNNNNNNNNNNNISRPYPRIIHGDTKKDYEIFVKMTINPTTIRSGPFSTASPQRYDCASLLYYSDSWTVSVCDIIQYITYQFQMPWRQQGVIVPAALKALLQAPH
jgi:hypothetical protein